MTTDEAIKLLQAEQVTEWNRWRAVEGPSEPAVGAVNLSGKKLAKADLSNVDFVRTNFNDADLSRASFHGATLDRVSF